MDDFRSSADTAARAIVQWSNPLLDYDTALNRNWPFVSLYEASAVLLAYLVWVGIGVAKKQWQGTATTTKPSREVVKTTYAQFMASPGRYILPLLSDPVKLAQTLYNLIQVRAALRWRELPATCLPTYRADRGVGIHGCCRCVLRFSSWLRSHLQ
jgi:hypothetical protein